MLNLRTLIVLKGFIECSLWELASQHKRPIKKSLLSAVVRQRLSGDAHGHRELNAVAGFPGASQRQITSGSARNFKSLAVDGYGICRDGPRGNANVKRPGSGRRFFDDELSTFALR